MKKHVLAAAVAAAIGVPAVAQVTVSGNIDVAAHRAQKVTTLSGSTTATTDQRAVGSGSGGTDASVTGWATSELVFTATEDLGGGLKATALFSNDISGNSLGAQRDRFVDLAGGFGTIRMGRFNSFVGRLNAFSGAGTSSQAGSVEHMTTGGSQLFGAAITGGSLQRNSGLIQYATPSFNGFTASAVYGKNSSDLSTTASSVTESQQHGFGLAYSAGPIRVEFASSQRKNKTAAVAGTAAKAFFFNSTANNTGTQTTAATAAVGDIVGGAASTNFTQSTNGPTLTVAGQNGVLLQGVVTVAGVAAASAVDATHDLDWLGASYNFGPASISVVHARRKAVSNSTTSLTQSTLNDATVNGIGIIVPTGAVTFRASAYNGKDNRGTGNTDDAKLSGHQISATYNLSKRTYLYAVMGESDVKRDTTASTVMERKEKSNSLGVVHTF